MKATFESKDPLEIKRLSKSTDMALFIWELVHNGLQIGEEAEPIT